MAHGFLTPQAVSGDRFWQNANWLWGKIKENLQKKSKKADPKGGPLMAFQKKGQQVEAVKVDVVQDPQKSQPRTSNLIGNSPVAKMLGAGKSDTASTISNPTPKGGSFTNIPGISATPKKLDADTFFKAAQTGVDPQTGRYLTSEERKDFLKKSKAQMNAPANVASAGIASASTEITKGDEAVVGAVTDLSKIVTNLVDAVKAQTASQKQIADKEKTTADKLASRALAQNEKNALGETAKSSGTLTPVGGLGGMSLGGGKGSGGGGLGGPALGVGGKVLAQAVGRRGVGRIGTRLAAKFGGKAAANAAGRFGAKAATGMGLKTAGGAVAKSLGKKIPLLGLGLGSIFAVQRAFKGDWLGAGMELASGAASTIPGLGTAGSIGIDAALAARDMGATPFAKGGIISSPTLSLMGEGNKKEGVFPLQGKEGKKTFEMFGQGMIDAQKKNKRDYASIQSAGLRQYYENEGGGEKLAKSLANVWGKISGVLGSLFSGALNSLMSPANAATQDPASYLGDPTVTGDEKEYLMRLMIAEAGGQGDVGMAAVGRSVLNRAGLIQSGSVGAGTFNAKSGSIMDVINASGQYQPVAQGKLKRALTPEERKKAEAALAIAMNQADMRGRLEAKGMKSDQINKLMAATGFRAGYAFNDPSQNVNVTKLGDHYFNTAGNKGLKVAGSVKMQEGFPSDGGSGGAAALAQAAASMKGMSSRSGPTGGRNACVWAVNKVFAKAGIPTPWGSSEYVPTAEEMMIKAGYQQVSSPQPGDLYVAPGQKHIGVITPDGKVISNSSSGAQFTWVDTVAGYNNYYGGKGKIYRMPGGLAAKGAKPSSPSGSPTPTAASPAKPKRGGQRGSGSSPGELKAAAATPPTGTQLAQVSAVDAMSQRTNTRGGGTTIINNNNVQSGSGAQIASADPGPGSGSMGLAALGMRLS
jgi:spore germination cell wall hydrolase CwlJ-like protein